MNKGNLTISVEFAIIEKCINELQAIKHGGFTLTDANVAKNLMKKTGTVATSLMLVAGLSFPVTQAYADPSTQEQADAALSKLNSLQEEMGQAENNYNQAIIEKEQAQAKVDEAQGRIEECNEEISNLQGQLGSRARSMYRTGSSTLLDLILGATSFSEFATNWELLTTLNENDQNLVSESKSLREEVSEQKKTLDEQKKVAEEKEAEANKTYAEAQSLVSTQQAVYNNLSEQAKAELEAAQKAQEEAEAAAAVAAIESSSTTTSYDNGSSYSGGSSSYNNSKPQTVTGNTVVDRAYGEIGKPYVWGGVGPDGYDCSGFVSYCLTGSHSRLGTTGTFMGWTRVSDPQPGDVCVNSYHTGIYIGGGQMIHAATYGIGVVVGSVQSDMIYVRY